MDVAQEVLERLDENRPEWFHGELKLAPSTVMPVALFGRVSLSAKLIEVGHPDLIAFAIAFAFASDFGARLMRGVTAWTEPAEAKLEALPDWLGVSLALPLGAAGVAASLVGTAAEMGAFERESIRKAVAWVNAAGFDARAGSRYFREGFGIQRDYVEPKPTWKTKAMGAALKPSMFVLDRIRKGPDVFLTNAERAEFVEEICVDLGI